MSEHRKEGWIGRHLLLQRQTRPESADATLSGKRVLMGIIRISESELAHTHSSILAWRIPWTEELGGLQVTGRKESDTTSLSLSLSNPMASVLRREKEVKRCVEKMPL